MTRGLFVFGRRGRWSRRHREQRSQSSREAQGLPEQDDAIRRPQDELQHCLLLHAPAALCSAGRARGEWWVEVCYADLVGGDRAAEIDFCEEHHGQEGGHAPTRMQVRTVTEVHCRYEVPAGSTSNVWHPVPGTTELVPVREADGWAKRARTCASPATS
ncbi:DUF6578 domain-containing protein [Streptomyces chartreusis]|uniref:DUF6578 domain-containing protein n=1 Tax=Streptomyces chartreusis TaxID=1969 RepID=UPI003D94C993